MRHISILALGLLIANAVQAQPTKIPTADEVKVLQEKYRSERDKIVKAGVAQRFLPAIMDKAEDLAKKSDAALAGGRMLQAAEAIRQARWQLPYQPLGVPDNVSRIIGNLRLRHSREINAVAFSPDGSKLATASADYTVKIWDLGNGHEIFSYAGHKDKVNLVAWTPDGKSVVSAGKGKFIKIWSPDGKDELSIPGVGEHISALALSKNGKHIITGQIGLPGNPKNGLFVYETKTGKLVRDLRDYNQKISSIAVSSEGNIVATGDDDGNLRLFSYPSFVDNVNQPAYWTQQDQTGAINQVAFSPDDKTLVRTSLYHVKLFATPMPGAPFQVGAPRQKFDTDRVRVGIYSHDGKKIYTGDEMGNVQVWDPESGQKVAEFKNAHAGPITGLAFTSSGNRLASCSGDFIVRLWDFDVVLQSRDFEGHEDKVWTTAFGPDGRIVSAGADKTVRVWSRDAEKPVLTIADHTAPVTVAQFSPDGKLIASAGGDKVVRIFNAADGKPLRTCEGHQGTITFLDFSHDSKQIVSCGVDRKIKIWNADTGKEIASIDDNPSIVAGVAFKPDGKQIAVANIDQTIRLYDTTGKLQHSWIAHGNAVYGVAYSPNGELLASGGADSAVQVWPLATPGQNAIRLTGHSGPVSSVAFRNDNIHLVSCGADTTVKLWKIEGNTGKELQTFKGHKDWVTSVAFSKDGFYVVSSSVDRRIKIWEITSRELPLLAEHSSAVDTVAVSPNGELIATGSADRSIKIWDRKTGVEIATLNGHKGAVMSVLFTPDSKRVISSGSYWDPQASLYKGSVHLWQVNPPTEVKRNLQQMNTLSRMRRESSYMMVSPDSKMLFVWLPLERTGTNSTVEVIDLETGDFLYEIKEGQRKVSSLALAANAKMCASGGYDGSVRLWNLAKDNAVMAPGGDWMLFQNKVGVADLALTPDASTLVVAGDDGEIKIAKVQGRETIKSFKGHPGRIGGCYMSPDGKSFATIDFNNVVKAWSIDGKEIRTWDFGRHQEMFILNLAFSADGRQIVTANANTTVYVLDLP